MRNSLECAARLDTGLLEDDSQRAEAGKRRIAEVKAGKGGQQQPLVSDGRCQHQFEQYDGYSSTGGQISRYHRLMPVEISLVAAVADNGVIGAEGGMPWHLPADLAHFKQITLGKPVLMGRLTWESIGRPLPGRRNLVLTRDHDWQGPGAERIGSLEEAVRVADKGGAQELMVIGGAEIYRQALPRAARIHLTRVHAEPWGDTLFPELDPNEWCEVARRERMSDEHNAWDLTFVVLERIR
jgi:dihydrofolate reductase